jgi:hypothetical protein
MPICGLRTASSSFWEIGFARGTQVRTLANHEKLCNYARGQRLPDQ